MEAVEGNGERVVEDMSETMPYIDAERRRGECLEDRMAALEKKVADALKLTDAWLIDFREQLDNLRDHRMEERIEALERCRMPGGPSSDVNTADLWPGFTPKEAQSLGISQDELKSPYVYIKEQELGCDKPLDITITGAFGAGEDIEKMKEACRARAVIERCATCMHWKPFANSQPDWQGECYRIVGGTRTLNFHAIGPVGMPATFGGEKVSLKATTDTVFLTKPDFGCTLHEPRK